MDDERPSFTAMKTGMLRAAHLLVGLKGRDHPAAPAVGN